MCVFSCREIFNRQNSNVVLPWLAGVKVNGYSFRRWEGEGRSGQPFKERICFCRNDFFPLTVDPFLKRLRAPMKQTGRHKCYTPYYKMWETTRSCIHSPYYLMKFTVRMYRFSNNCHLGSEARFHVSVISLINKSVVYIYRKAQLRYSECLSVY